MYYNKGELTYEECIKVKKQGFVLPLYDCNKKWSCPQFRNRKGRSRCPGRLLLTDLTDHVSYTFGKFCGWNPLSTIIGGESTVSIKINEPEKFTPQHIVPII